MKHIDIFLTFPETDEEILDLGEVPGNYLDIVKSLSTLKCHLTEYEYCFFYDSRNLDAFLEQAEIVCPGRHLHSLRAQMQILLSKRAKNITDTASAMTDHVFRKWDFNSACTCDMNDILIASAERMHRCRDESHVVVLSFTQSDRHDRDLIPVLIDAPHRNEMPVLYNIPYFHPVPTFTEWLHLQDRNGDFSLRDLTRFTRTSYIYRPSHQRIYEELSTGRYWYYDFFHKDNKRHYEVFDSTGEHLGEADTNGNLDTLKKDTGKSIKKYIR